MKMTKYRKVKNHALIVNRALLRHILNTNCKTGLEWIFADIGKLNLRSLIQIRRLKYLWHILSRDESELISRIYQTQRQKV